MKTERTVEQVKQFLATAGERFKQSATAEAKWREDALEDMKFYSGDQWDDIVRERRKKKNKPCLTINRMKAFKRQITNQIRAQRPAIEVSPREDGASVEAAELIQGMVRDVEVSSEAEVVYDNGTDTAVITGRGCWRAVTKYKKGNTFEQEVRIVGFKNQFMVYDDPGTDLPDRSDRRFAFVVSDVPSELFKELHPKAEAASLTDFKSIGDDFSDWITDQVVRVAEYYYVEDSETEIHELADGTIAKGTLPENVIPKQTRILVEPIVKWAKITAMDVLDEEDIPCSTIPLVMVLGEELNINGKTILSGMVRDGKDSQRMYNFSKTATSETIGLMPKAPFVAAVGQIAGHEDEWKNANIDDVAVLQYEPVSEGGNLLPAPQRINAEPAVQALLATTQGAAQDMMATIGLNDANLGMHPKDESGKAVLLRQKQGDISTGHYSDNLSRAVRLTGRIVLDMFKQLNTKPRQQRVIAQDKTVKHVVVHSNDLAGAKKIATDANQKIVNLASGDYDVTVSVGPSYETKRQEAVASIMALVSAAPQVLNVVGDLLVGNMDWHNSQEIAKRFKKLLPPALQGDDQSPEAQLQQAQSSLQTLMQQHEQVVAALQEANQIIVTKQLENASKERIANINAQAGLVESEIRAHGENALAAFNATVVAIQSRLDHLHETMQMKTQAQLDQQTQAAAPQPVGAQQ